MAPALKKILRKPYQLVQNLVNPVPPGASNFLENRLFWENYAERWSPRFVELDDTRVQPDEKPDFLECLGDEWGRKGDVDYVVRHYIHPYLNSESIAGEIGCGGGRIARRVAPMVKKLHCFDISEQMLNRARAALAGTANVQFVLLDSTKFPSELQGKLDFIYSFDVFVHLDLHTIWKYFQEIHAALRPAGRVFLHTTSLKAPGGWEFFASQDHYSATSHYFISPEIVETFASHAGFKLLEQSEADKSNFYLNRDFLFVMEKLK